MFSLDIIVHIAYDVRDPPIPETTVSRSRMW